MRWQILVNPKAGKRPADMGRINAALIEHGIDHQIEVVVSHEAMRRRVVETVQDGTPLAIGGGDGTFGLAVDAIMGAGISSPPLLGMVPTGTGCDLLRTFGITPTIESAIPHLLGDASYLIDVGRLDGSFGVRYFANVAQVGVGAAAVQTARRLPRSWGVARYPVAFLARLPRFPVATVTVSGERPLVRSAVAVFVANAQFFAGGWNVAPRALMVDGHLDVQLIDVKKHQAPALVPRLIKGLHLTHPGVIRRSLAGFEIETSEPWPLEADGDYVGTTPVRVTTIPGAIRLKI